MSANKLSSKHQKHTKLHKPDYGIFGRNELAIHGTSCSSIKDIAANIIDRLATKNNIAYVDSEHTAEDGEKGPAGLIYTEQNSTSQFDLPDPVNEYHIKAFFNEQDLILVNGNHYSAKSQIVVVDALKPLDKYKEKLTDVKLIIISDASTNVSDEIKGLIADIDSIPVCKIDDTERIAEKIQQLITQAIPPLSGLVLAGGKSTRMHTDKTVLEYHAKPQREHLHLLLENFCGDVFISCREEQAGALPDRFNCITDSFLDMGPMGALLSAFRQNPNTAWLSVACDLPLLSSSSLEYLAKHRNPSKVATAFNNPDSSFPEPLITIWEPKSYPILLHFLSLGYSCPRKILINSEIELLEAPDPAELMNVNNPAEYKEVQKVLAAT